MDGDAAVLLDALDLTRRDAVGQEENGSGARELLELGVGERDGLGEGLALRGDEIVAQLAREGGHDARVVGERHDPVRAAGVGEEGRGDVGAQR